MKMPFGNNLSRVLLAMFFIVAGVNHFISPASYVQIMPPLPRPEALVYVSGAAEIAGGVGILLVRTRKLATLGLIALLLAVLPANIYGAVHGMEISGRQIPAWILWLRLPVQPLLIWWVYNACWKPRELPR